MTKKNQMYFAANPDAKHDEHLVDYHIDDIDLKFTTDAGVFSKLRIDYGSGVLIKTMKDLTFPKAGILDVGTGYGPMGLFAAKFWPDQEVDMVDVNEKKLMTKVYGNCEILARDKGYYILMSKNN